MIELAKAVGGIGWVIGLVMLFVEPSIGLLILVVALLATLFARAKDRERKHKELLRAAETGGATLPAPPTPAAAPERLAQLDMLKEAGTISDDEYEAKRKDILDSL